MKTVAVVGASNHREKFGNKAVRAFRDAGYTVVPINTHEAEVEVIEGQRGRAVEQRRLFRQQDSPMDGTGQLPGRQRDQEREEAPCRETPARRCYLRCRHASTFAMRTQRARQDSP